MLLIDILVVVAAVCLGILCFVVYDRLRGRRAMSAVREEMRRQRGEANAIQATADRMQLCWYCSRPTWYIDDLFVNGAWVHRSCHENILNPKEKS